MIKEIKYTTLSTDASDYTCNDGELGAVANMVNEDGSLVPISEATELFTMPNGTKKVFVHESTSFENEDIKRHYIFLIEAENTQSLKYCTADDAADGVITTLTNIGAGLITGEILFVDTIGNVLAISTTDGLQYVIWKDGSYTYLGKRPGDITARVSVRTDEPITRQRTTDINVGSIRTEVANSGVCDLSTFADRVELCNTVFAGVNLCEADAEYKGRFCYPFLIRVAYRMFDGVSLICHTQPILVNPMATGRPRIYIEPYLTGGNITISLFSVEVSLAIAANAGAWKDYIQSVDIFITPQAQGYTEDNDSMRYVYKGSGTEDEAECNAAFAQVYQENEHHPYSAFSESDWNTYGVMPIIMKRLDNKTAADVIKEESRFYLIKSISLDEMTPINGYLTSEVDLKPSKVDFQSLPAREVMTDSQGSRRSIVASATYNYNSRLCMVVEKEKRDNPQVISSIPIISFSGSQGTVTGIVFEVEDGGETKFVASDITQDVVCRPEHIIHLFADNTKVKAAWITTSTKTYRIPMRKHDFLNGVYAFNDFDALCNESTETQDTIGTITELGSETSSNVIIQSEVNNPFFFPTANVISVGVGKVMAIRAAIKAMSTSQFGEYPVYALATDGVWGIYVASDGRFSYVRLVTPDVCLNALTVAQIDSAVIFASARGLMMLSGSTATCISDSIRTSKAFKVTDLPSGDMFVSSAGVNENVVEYGSFLDFIKNCRVAYDYVRQRIIVFNPTKEDGERKYSYAYVYSLKGKSWGILATNAESVINTYGSLLLTTDNGTIATGDEGNITDINGLVMTRPCKLGYPDKKKTIRTIIQRGVFNLTQIDGSILYGSNDLHSWFLVASSKTHILGGITGSPYKYFRIGVIAHLNEGDSLYGCTVEFEIKQDNKLR